MLTTRVVRPGCVRLIRAPLRELAPRFAPAREVALDHLALGARAYERVARRVDLAVTISERILGATGDVERVTEQVPAPCDEALAEDAACGGDLLVAPRSRVRESLPCEADLREQLVEPRARFVCIADRGR